MLPKLPRGLRRVTLFAVSALLVSVTAATAAPKRTFFCGDGAGSLVVTVLSQQKIRVVVDLGGEDGKFTMTMNKQGAGYHFVDGEYEVTIDDGQDSLIYSAPDYGTTGCAWSGH